MTTYATGTVGPLTDCPTCGHKKSSRANMVFDFIKRRTYAICDRCRNELPEQK